MNVYIVIETDYYHYEGGSQEVVGVFRSRHDAFNLVRKDIPTAKREKGKVSWDYPDSNPQGFYTHSLTIERHKVG